MLILTAGFIADNFHIPEYLSDWRLIPVIVISVFLLRIIVKCVIRFHRFAERIRERHDRRMYQRFLMENFDTADINELSGQEFESFVAGLLEKVGFTDIRMTRASGDHGIDIIAEANGLTVGIQCKRYARPVGNYAVQEVYAGAEFYGCDRALVITNSSYTAQAIEEADRLGVTLWDKNALSRVVRKALKKGCRPW
ncbi:MAG: restriction endonuclease [Lachnospiraceae bacterium]|nr:restriction endonuclease [Lachnospiraceae bacterium]